MTLESLAGYLVTRWEKSKRVSCRGRAIVINKGELEMIVVALRGGGALRSLADTSTLSITSSDASPPRT